MVLDLLCEQKQEGEGAEYPGTEGLYSVLTPAVASVCSKKPCLDVACTSLSPHPEPLPLQSLVPHSCVVLRTGLQTSSQGPGPLPCPPKPSVVSSPSPTPRSYPPGLLGQRLAHAHQRLCLGEAGPVASATYPAASFHHLRLSLHKFCLWSICFGSEPVVKGWTQLWDLLGSFPTQAASWTHMAQKPHPA
jgi:hypothetical protein